MGLRIALDVSKAGAPGDGIATYVGELLRALWPHRGAGLEILPYATQAPLAPERFRQLFADLGESLRLLPGRGPADGEADLFHATAWSLPPRFAGPLLFTCYDLTFLTHPSCHTLENRVHCLEGTLRAIHAQATFLAISEATADALRQQLSIGPERVAVVYPAAAPRFRPRPAEEARSVAARYGLDRFVLTVGTREPRKNLELLAAAHAGLPTELRSRYPLVMVGGEGWAGPAGRAPDLAGARTLGRVPDDDLVALYSAATLFAYPSLAEGFGLPVVEAMACGAPVVASSSPALPEVAGDAARLADPRDVALWRRTLQELLEDEAARSELARRGPERAARYSWDGSAREIVALYRRLAT